jgi:hypothetical protein
LSLINDMLSSSSGPGLRALNPAIAGSNPAGSTSTRGSVPDTWVTVYSGDMGNTFGPKGFSSGSSLQVS